MEADSRFPYKFKGQRARQRKKKANMNVSVRDDVAGARMGLTEYIFVPGTVLSNLPA